MLNRLGAWAKSIFLRSRLEREMREEMDQHIERATERLMARGMGRAAAVAVARREFGVVEWITEEARDARGGRWVDATLADARFALRHFRRRPLVTATMVLVLALGIGSNVALFTLLHSVRTQPAPGIPRDDALVRIRGIQTWNARGLLVTRGMSYDEAREYAALTQLFNGVASWSASEVVLDVHNVGRDVVPGTAYHVSSNYFPLLGVRLVAGTGLPVSEPADGSQASQVGVISHLLWDRHFGQSPDALGRTLKVNGIEITVVGVAPPRFRGVDDRGPDLKVWLPLGARSLTERQDTAAPGGRNTMSVVARLQPGVDLRMTQPAVQAVAARTHDGRAPGSEQFTDASADVVPLLAGNDLPRRNTRLAEQMTLGVLGLLILLIACTTAGALLAGLAVARRREIAVRLSLGAPRRRVVRQLVTESVLLSATAGALGLFVTFALTRTLGTKFAPDLQLVVAWPVLTFTVGVAVVTGIGFGLSPALHATRLAVADVLKDAAASVSAARSWLQRGLVVTQIALTQPLLVGVGTVFLIVRRDLDARPSMAVSDRVISMEFGFSMGNASVDRRAADVERLRARIAGLPGVLRAIRNEHIIRVWTVVVHPADRVATSPTTPFRIRSRFAPPGYFELLDIPTVRGRTFEPAEELNRSPSIIIGSDFARNLWGTANPIGRRLQYGRSESGDSTAMVVVGVVDERFAAGGEAGDNVLVFIPWGAPGAQSLLVRTVGPAVDMFPAIRAIAVQEAPDLPIAEMTTLAEIESGRRRVILQAGGAAAAGGLLALLLSAIGLYAVVAFAVGQRTREIGIRTALGAQRRKLILDFFASGLRLSLNGLVLGLPLSLIAVRVISLQVGAPYASTPVLAGMIGVLVIVVASVATWIPARRAAGVDPLIALRSE